MSNYIKVAALLLGVVCMMLATVGQAQDDYEENYGGPGGGTQGGQGEGDNYQNGNEDGYSGNSPNYQQNIDSDSSNGGPSSYSPQGGSDAEGDYDGDEGTAASAPGPTIARMRRSVEGGQDQTLSESSAPKLRVKRHGKYYIGPVYTYVKTDKHANFKWGVKHKVGKKHY